MVVGLAIAVAAVAVPVGVYVLQNPAAEETDVYGYAYMALPLDGATVRVCAMESDGGSGDALATTVTGEDGYFELSVERDSSAFLLVTTSGGQYVDSASGEHVAAGPGFSLRTVVAPEADRAPLTPLTTFATARASWLADGGRQLDASVEAAFAATARQFNVETITNNDPAIASDPEDVQFAGVTSRQLGLILAGLDAEAAALGVTSLGLTDALASDLTDGVLDGQAGSDPILIEGTVPLPADAMTSGLQDAIDAISASPSNKTHLPAPQIAPQAAAIDPTAGSLYFATSALPAWTDGEAGTARIEGSGGRKPYVCELVAGELPPGFTLSSGCVVSGGGTPMLGESSMWVSAPFTVRLSDASQPSRSVSAAFRITIVARGPTIAVSGGSCPQPHRRCSLTVATATGGTPPYYFTTDSFAYGTPPMGMTLGVDGVLSGTPSRAGSSTFRVCVVDLVGAKSCASTTVVVGQASSSPVASLPQGFPSNLPAGTYRISACVTMGEIDFSTCVDSGEFVVTDDDASALAQGLSDAADEVRSVCDCSVRYTAFNGTEFDLIITDPASGSVTTLRVVKVR